MRRLPPSRSSFTRTVGLAIVFACITLLAVASGATGFAVTVPDSIDVPDRTVTYDGTSYTISKVGRVNHGGEIQGTVDAPADEEYRVYLKNADAETVDTRAKTGDSSFSFSTTGLELHPGTYFVMIYDGEFTNVVPVVVSGYDVSADVPDSVDSDESATVTVSVTETAATEPPAQVQVVFANDDDAIRVNATESNGEYVATVDAESLSTGSYAVYAAVRGENETETGQKVLLGLGDRYSMTVTDSTPTPTATSDDHSNDGTDGDDGDTPGESKTATTETATTTVTARNTSTPETTTTTATAAVTDATATDRSTTAKDAPTDSSTEADDGVVTPSSPTTSESVTPEGQPGFGISTALVCVGAIVPLLRRI